MSRDAGLHFAFGLPLRHYEGRGRRHFASVGRASLFSRFETRVFSPIPHYHSFFSGFAWVIRSVCARGTLPCRFLMRLHSAAPSLCRAHASHSLFMSEQYAFIGFHSLSVTDARASYASGFSRWADDDGHGASTFFIFDAILLTVISFTRARYGLSVYADWA